MLLPCSVPIDARTGQVQILAAAPGGIRNKAPPHSYDQPVALVTAKLALDEAMRAQGITRTELARRLGLQENAIRRLLDLDHRSHIDQIDGLYAGSHLCVFFGHPDTRSRGTCTNSPSCTTRS